MITATKAGNPLRTFLRALLLLVSQPCRSFHSHYNVPNPAELVPSAQQPRYIALPTSELPKTASALVIFVFSLCVSVEQLNREPSLPIFSSSTHQAKESTDIIEW